METSLENLYVVPVKCYLTILSISEIGDDRLPFC